MKKHWDAVNLILHKKKPDLSPMSILHNNKLITEPNQIADIVNKYYVNVAPELVKKLPKSKSNLTFSSYLKTPNPIDSFYCRLTNNEEVSKIIDSLDVHKAEDIYKFPIRIVKDLKNQISEPLVQIINSSFSVGTFPERLKLAKVKPLYKGGDQNLPKNYRPISILPIFDKIVERLMHTRLQSFLRKQNILNSAQYGFQRNKSTSLAIMDLLKEVSNSLQNKLLSCYPVLK